MQERRRLLRVNNAKNMVRNALIGLSLERIRIDK